MQDQIVMMNWCLTKVGIILQLRSNLLEVIMLQQLTVAWDGV